MKISTSARQYHLNGRRISKALYEEIKAKAFARRELDVCTDRKHKTCHWVRGLTASAYRWARQAGEVSEDKFNELRLNAGEIDELP